MDSVTATLSHLSSRLPGPLPVLIVAGLAIGLLLYVLLRNHPSRKTIEQHLQRARADHGACAATHPVKFLPHQEKRAIMQRVARSLAAAGYRVPKNFIK